MNTLVALVKEIFLETFYEEKKKKQLAFFTIFYISYKSDIKSFLK